MKKKPVVQCTGSIDIPLGACLTMPTKRLIADLREIARLCNVAKNAMIKFWLRWHEDNPDYKPQGMTSHGVPVMAYRKIDAAPEARFGKPVLKGTGKSKYFESATEDRQYLKRENVATGKVSHLEFGGDAKLEPAWMPQHLRKLMYCRGAEVAPTLYVSIVKAALFKEVEDNLKAKTPYNHTGRAKFQHEAIRMHERQVTTFRELEIPIPNGSGAICYEGRMNRELSTGIDARMLEIGKASCIVRFPLFSREAGRETTDAICRLEIGGLSEGNKSLLRRIASRQDGWVMNDSTIVAKDVPVNPKKLKGQKGKKSRMEQRWYLRLIYKQPRKSLGLDPENVAELTLGRPDCNSPFQMSFGDVVKDVWCGVPIIQESIRLETRRKVMRYRRGHGNDKARGHGRGAVLAVLRPYERSGEDMAKRYQWELVKKIIEWFCVRNNCGTILYREPDMSLRPKSFFAQHKLDFNWTAFLNRLGSHAHLYGIALNVERMGPGDYRDRFGKIDPTNPPSTHPTGVKTLELQEKPGVQGLKRGKIRRRG